MCCLSSTHDNFETTAQHERDVSLAASETTQPVRQLWRNRDDVLLWSGQCISAFGSQASCLAFSLVMLAITGSAAQVGLLGVIRSFPAIICMLPAGAWIDRWDRKRLMILCELGRALALGRIPMTAALGHVSIIQLSLVALLEGTERSFPSSVWLR